MKSNVDPAAARGFSEAADNYDRGRPEYPPQVVEWLRDCVSLRPGKVAIELGAGTGKFTRSLVLTGAQIVAIEPVAQMRAFISSTAPQAQALEGSAHAIAMPDASADAVVSAQAFHWFADTAALGEIHRVLKPHGVLGLVWNLPDERVPWVAEFARILAPAEDESPFLFRRGHWRNVFPDPRFTELRSAEYSFQHRGTPREVIIERVLSLSFVANMSGADRAVLLERLAHLIATQPALRDQATIDFPHRTFAYHCESRPYETT